MTLRSLPKLRFWEVKRAIPQTTLIVELTLGYLLRRPVITL